MSLKHYKNSLLNR